MVRLLDRAQQRLDTLRDVVAGANEGDVGTDIRIAVGDAIVPLNIALEVAEPL